jgi:hypothetical protein
LAGLQFTELLEVQESCVLWPMGTGLGEAVIVTSGGVHVAGLPVTLLSAKSIAGFDPAKGQHGDTKVRLFDSAVSPPCWACCEHNGAAVVPLTTASLTTIVDDGLSSASRLQHPPNTLNSAWVQ